MRASVKKNIYPSPIKNGQNAKLKIPIFIKTICTPYPPFHLIIEFGVLELIALHGSKTK